MHVNSPAPFSLLNGCSCCDFNTLAARAKICRWAEIVERFDKFVVGVSSRHPCGVGDNAASGCCRSSRRLCRAQAPTLRSPGVRRWSRDLGHGRALAGVVYEARERAARAIRALPAIFDVSQERRSARQTLSGLEIAQRIKCSLNLGAASDREG